MKDSKVNKHKTYKELLEYHMEKISEEDANMLVNTMIIITSTPDGTASYSVFPSSNVTKVVGLMELAKLNYAGS